VLAPNTILQNRYRIVRELGHGGMGTVYEAIDQRVSCIVALKETLVGRNSEARSAFEHEAALLANLRHPVLPKVMDYFSEGDGEFLVMEYIAGHDLAELMKLRGGPFLESEVLKWADQILKLLEYLHFKQPPILHRDIKPANLKVTRDGEVFLLDFGLAKGTTGQMSTVETSKSIVGYTPAYAPLEQIHGLGTDPRSDLYSLGATLYHLLTGQPPANAPARYAALEDEKPDPLVPAHELNPVVSPSVSQLIAAAVAVSRRQRPGSASEMRQQLAAIVKELEAKQAAASDKGDDKETLRRTPASIKDQSPVLPQTTPPPQELTKTKPPPAKDQPISVTLPPPGLPIQPAPQKTIKVDRFVRAATDPVPAIVTKPEQSGTRTGLIKRRATLLIVVGIALVATTAIAILAWYVQKNSGGDTKLTASQPAQTSDRTATPSPPAGMAFIPSGEFIMGRDNGDEYERPAHKVTVNSFFIDLHEVTVSEYHEFVKATGRHATPAYLAAIASDPKLQAAGRQPITGVQWADAISYCTWMKKRLPTEEEWEFAARGSDGRLYPWGNEWKADLANVNHAKDGVADVGSFGGSSPFGLVDMIGNAWEWTGSELKAYPGGYLPDNTTDELRAIRGAAYDSDLKAATATYRRGYPAAGNYDYSKTGFRCAQAVASTGAPENTQMATAPSPSPTPSPSLGAIVGRVTDAAGAPIPATRVSVRRDGDSAGTLKYSNDNGNYIFARLADGIYTIRFSADNFRTVEYTNVKVSGTRLTINPTMEVGTGTVTMKALSNNGLVTH
jgi:formylglycine-generating enzyme required for sulfatase activity/serine/threonine protein kinase